VRIQLLTFPGCPNAEAARATLRAVLASSGIAVDVEEVDTTAPDTPESLRGWGSPTVLIDGVDVEGREPSGPSCRLYRDEQGRLHSGPPAARLRRALGVWRERLVRRRAS
jgi:hypothetical protein